MLPDLCLISNTVELEHNKTHWPDEKVMGGKSKQDTELHKCSSWMLNMYVCRSWVRFSMAI